MYGACCAGCESEAASGLGLFVPYGSQTPTAVANAAPPDDPWWEDPARMIGAAIAQRIGGSTPPYSPGMYEYGQTGYATVPQPAAAPAPAPAGLSPVTGLLLAGVAIGGLKLAGVF